MKKISWLIALLAVFGLLLVGCGGNGGGNPDEGNEVSEGNDGGAEVVLAAADANTGNTLAADTGKTIKLFLYDEEGPRKAYPQDLSAMAAATASTAAYKQTVDGVDKVKFVNTDERATGKRITYVLEEEIEITTGFQLAYTLEGTGANFSVLFYDTKEVTDEETGATTTEYDSAYVTWAKTGVNTISLKDYAGKKLRGFEFSVGTDDFYISGMSLKTDAVVVETDNVTVTATEIKLGDTSASWDESLNAVTTEGDHKIEYNHPWGGCTFAEIPTSAITSCSITFNVSGITKDTLKFKLSLWVDGIESLNWVSSEELTVTTDGEYTITYEFDSEVTIPNVTSFYFGLESSR